MTEGLFCLSGGPRFLRLARTTSGMMETMAGAWADGIGTFTGRGKPLCFLFPAPALGSAETDHNALPLTHSSNDSLRRIELRPVRTAVADLDEAPTDVDDAYLRLHLLSHRLVRPNEINLDGIFGILPNVCWTSLGPVDPDDLPATRVDALAAGVALQVMSVDKFPRMTDFVVPTGVRIADADRVRLGAHLAIGTTVMHEGFVNFNAGTLGESMVEGRISQGVVVGAGSDIGGGASIMGTLSGGGAERITIGKNCLLGANSGLGISLGDDCVVEAGLYLTAGAVVTMPDGRKVKARELSGCPGLLFRRNSMTGTVEAIGRSGSWGTLNPDLHGPH